MLIISFEKYDATSFFKSISKTFNKVVANHYLMFLLQNKTKHWNRNLVGEPKDVKLQGMKTHGIIFVELKKRKKKCMSTNQEQQFSTQEDQHGNTMMKQFAVNIAGWFAVIQ